MKKKESYKKDDRVVVEYDKKYFLGTITRIANGQIYFKFDDGDTGKASLGSKRILGKAIGKKVKKALSKNEAYEYLVSNTSDKETSNTNDTPYRKINGYNETSHAESPLTKIDENAIFGNLKKESLSKNVKTLLSFMDKKSRANFSSLKQSFYIEGNIFKGKLNKFYYNKVLFKEALDDTNAFIKCINYISELVVKCVSYIQSISLSLNEQKEYKFTVTFVPKEKRKVSSLLADIKENKKKRMSIGKEMLHLFYSYPTITIAN